MKLKKIASLALAGIMAVSMLAGCSTGNNNNNSSSTPEQGEPEVVPTSAVVDIFNKYQDVTQKVQVKFTADADLEKKAQQAVEELGEMSVANAATLLTNLQKLTGFTAADSTSAIANVSDIANVGFLKNSVTSADAASHEGEVNTVLFVQALAGSQTVLAPEAAAKSFLTSVQTFINKLPATITATPKPGDDYLDYSYTGSVCVISTATNTGAPLYYLVGTITQTAALKTAPEI